LRRELFQEATLNNLSDLVSYLNSGIPNEVLESIGINGVSFGLEMIFWLGLGVSIISAILVPFSGAAGIISDYGILSSVFELLGNLSSNNDLVRNDFRVLLTIFSELPS
jgi:hypothetical protein